MDWVTLTFCALILAGVFLILQAWFWVALFFFLGLASFFSVLASIFHFQILAAIGFLILGAFLWFVMAVIYEIKYNNPLS